MSSFYFKFKKITRHEGAVVSDGHPQGPAAVLLLVQHRGHQSSSSTESGEGTGGRAHPLARRPATEEGNWDLQTPRGGACTCPHTICRLASPEAGAGLGVLTPQPPPEQEDLWQHGRACLGRVLYGPYVQATRAEGF